MGPVVVICLSGKRKCGKDFVGNLLANRLKEIGDKVIIYGISYPLKEEYAQLNGIDAERLKYDMQYKELYRQDMIAWGEKIRNDDSGYFCRLLRVESTLSMREMRGFVFIKGIDDQMTECGLDEYTKWDVVITNDIQCLYLSRMKPREKSGESRKQL
ncbi:unnamed protein product [Onchocerca ochengi]|uniref:Phosphomevalonate kinase n=1 Tax=Onchocerca ochengi TaxID=42157 RepID=A0A182EF88_ONCOC|nr:unnamed protein product [Onchocerca ochengi]